MNKPARRWWRFAWTFFGDDGGMVWDEDGCWMRVFGGLWILIGRGEKW